MQQHKHLFWTVSLLQDLWQTSRGAEEARGGAKKSRVSILQTECPTLQQSTTRSFSHQVHKINPKICLELISWSAVKVEKDLWWTDVLLCLSENHQSCPGQKNSVAVSSDRWNLLLTTKSVMWKHFKVLSTENYLVLYF